MVKISFVLYLFLLFYNIGVWAQSSEDLLQMAKLPSSVSLQLGSDSSDSKSSHIFVDYGLQNFQRFYFSYSTSLSEGIEGEESLKTTSILLGWSTDPLEESSYSLNYNFDGDKDKFYYNGLQFDYAYESEKHAFLFSTELRAIHLNYEGLNATVNSSLDGTSLGFEYGFLGWEDISFGVSYTQYFYEKNIKKIVDTFETILINNDPLLLNLISGLQNYSTGLFGNYSFWYLSLGLHLNVSESAADLSQGRSASLKIDVLYWDDVSIGVTVGKSKSFEEGEEVDESTFGSINMSYTWY